MRPGVLECGCLWDGRMLSIESGCTVSDHGLGRVPFVRRRLSIAGVSLDQPEWHAVLPAANAPPIETDRLFSWVHDDDDGWPSADGVWIWGD